MFWSTEMFDAEVQAQPGLISPYDRSRLKHGAYELLLGQGSVSSRKVNARGRVSKLEIAVAELDAVQLADLAHPAALYQLAHDAVEPRERRDDAGLHLDAVVEAARFAALDRTHFSLQRGLAFFRFR